MPRGDESKTDFMWVKDLEKLRLTDGGKELIISFSHAINTLIKKEHDEEVLYGKEFKSKQSLIESNEIAINAIVECLQGLNRDKAVIYDLGPAVEGSTLDIAKESAGLLREIKKGNSEFKPPCYVVFGQRNVKAVHSEKNGYGGKSIELAFLTALELKGESGIDLFCGKTNGKDGNLRTRAAGAIINDNTYTSLTRGTNIDSYKEISEYFAPLNQARGIVKTGATGAPKARVFIAKVS